MSFGFLHSQIFWTAFAGPVLITLVGGFIISHFYYRKQSRRKQLRYTVSSSLVLRDSSDQVPQFLNADIRHESQQELVSVSLVTIMNAGLDPIYRSDVAPTAPIKITTENDRKILDALLEPVDSNDKMGGLRLERCGEELCVEFSFIEKGSYAVFQVAHNGVSAKDIVVSGHIIGGEPIARAVAEYRVPYAVWTATMGNLTLLCVFLTYILLETYWFPLVLSWTIATMALSLWHLRREQEELTPLIPHRAPKVIIE